MVLPNYTPEGEIFFCNVPWGDDYSHVRLYGSLEEQKADIQSLTLFHTDEYVYIGRTRRLKVSIPADRLYHANYCMYRNPTVGTGWIYCFITEVEYVNDNTSEIELETDIFQTYLYGTDWTIPPCYINRATVGDDMRYLLTDEPDFPLIYSVGENHFEQFNLGGFVIITSGYAEQNDNVIEDILNPEGYYAKPAPITVQNGIVCGANYYYIPLMYYGDVIVTDLIQTFLNGMAYAGSVESIIAVLSVPDFAPFVGRGEGFLDLSDFQQSYNSNQITFTAPDKGKDFDGYTPRNGKLYCYPYNFLRLTDYSGSVSDLRYELFTGGGSPEIALKYAASPSCSALAFPLDYRNLSMDFESGIAVNCGAQGSWNGDAYKSWLSQNAPQIMASALDVGLTVAGGAGMGIKAASLAKNSLAAAKAGAKHAGYGKANFLRKAGNAIEAGGVRQAMNVNDQIQTAHRQPTLTKGQPDYNLRWATGIQGISAQRICVRPEIAEQIDEYFDVYGYSVQRIEELNLFSRPSWNYAQTFNCTPISLGEASSGVAPFSRGRGTPASVLAAIGEVFDSGVTMWHTTDGFGNYKLGN